MPRGVQVTPAAKERYRVLIAEGHSRAAACRMVGVSESWAKGYDKKFVNTGATYRRAKEARAAEIAAVKELDELSPEALASLDDFELFRRRYLGHVSTPWQVETAERLWALRQTPHKEFVVLNCPPGVGKTTLVHDIACWFTVKDRSIRGLIGTRLAGNGERMLRRIRRSLERALPYRAASEDVALGLAVDAERSLAQDFGRFKPITGGDVWRGSEFVVEQLGDQPIEEKEPTWSSYGVDSGVLGNRFEVIFWDDLVDRTNNRTVDTRIALQELWDSELETRLEPGGLLVLLGQRLGGGDLYAYCRQKAVEADEEDDDEDVATDLDGSGVTSTGFMYHRIVFPAHDEGRCEEVHKKGLARAWPEGCLLDPYRVPWRDLRRLKSLNRTTYEVSYQQRDVDPEGVLVNPVWVKGGRDHLGVDHPGCWDPERGLGDRPLVGDSFTSVITVDPSPTRYWAIQWWVTPMGVDTPLESRVRYLMDVYRQKMTAPELLYAEPTAAGQYAFSGMLEAWRLRAVESKLPLSHLVIEENAAQRFFTQQPYFRQWCSQHHVTFRPHQTHRNKNDPNYGVSSLSTVWKYGLVRLPGKIHDPGRTAALKLVDEVQKWTPGGGGTTDDCVMAHWFHEIALPQIAVVDLSKIPVLKRPSWMTPELVGS